LLPYLRTLFRNYTDKPPARHPFEQKTWMRAYSSLICASGGFRRLQAAIAAKS
jgi:hypothetical protein